MVRPQAALVRLRGVSGVSDGGGVDEGARARVVGGEGDVVRRVPVFGGDFEGEWVGEERVDGGEDGAAVGDGKGAVLWGG